MRSSLWLALTACMALRPLGCDALFASLLLMATHICGSGASSYWLLASTRDVQQCSPL
jgi:hypothetical protein